MSDRIEQKVDAMRSQVASKLKKWDRPIWGYVPAAEPDRAEGELWEDSDGKQWTVKDGIKQSITKLQDAKTPWWCPKCEHSMAHKFDTKFYRLYGQCYDCTIKEHTQMMIDGTWEEFEKRKVRENEKAFLKDKIQERQDYIRTFKVPQVHFENGGWEELAKIEHFKDMFVTLREDIKFCEERLLAIAEEEALETKETTNDNA